MSNRRRNLRKTAAALTGAAALMALLTACNGTATGSVTSDGGTAAPAAGDAAGNGGSTGSNGSTGSGSGSGSGATPAGNTGSGSSTGGSTGSSTSGGSSASGGSVAAACQASGLGYSWADSGSGTGQQKHAVVALTNKSGHTCTMYGFPGVDLVNSGQQWSLQRTNATPQRVTLANGASANFAITFLVPAQGDSATFTPTTVVITAPDQRTSYDLPWHGGAVVLQDGATHPGTYVGPVGK